MHRDKADTWSPYGFCTQTWTHFDASICGLLLLSTSSLNECLLSSCTLEWQEWAPQKPPEWAVDLYTLTHHDSPTQTHQNTHNTPDTYLWLTESLAKRRNTLAYHNGLRESFPNDDILNWHYFLQDKTNVGIIMECITLVFWVFVHIFCVLWSLCFTKTILLYF